MGELLASGWHAITPVLGTPRGHEGLTTMFLTSEQLHYLLTFLVVRCRFWRGPQSLVWGQVYAYNGKTTNIYLCFIWGQVCIIIQCHTPQHKKPKPKLKQMANICPRTYLSIHLCIYLSVYLSTWWRLTDWPKPCIKVCSHLSFLSPLIFFFNSNSSFCLFYICLCF